MPAIAALRDKGVTAPLANCMETLPGAIWPEIATGISCWRRGLFYHPLQVHTGEGLLRPVDVTDENPDDYFWVRAAHAGHRVVSIDPPQTAVVSGLPGIQLVEWATHDRNYSPQSEPPDLLAELHERFGPHPIWNCNQQTGLEDSSRREFLGALRRSVDIKTELTAEYLDDDWGLVACTFGESHCVGHHYWSYLDPRCAEYRADAADDLKDAVREIYSRIDGSIAELIAAAGPDATVVVLASHGMGPYIGGEGLLWEFVRRMGLDGEGQGRRVTGWRRFVPRRLKRLGKRVVTAGRRNDDGRVVTKPFPIARGRGSSWPRTTGSGRCA